ncbi:MAG: hypothetical protein Fur0010_26600 [Bdellovibrio sp.]
MILSYFIASPLSHLEKIIHQITEGHHHHRVSNVEGGQEIYGLTNSFNIMMDEINTAQEKIKTIGDSYMAISPLNASPVEGADKIVELAQGLLRELDEVNRLNQLDLKLRIGIHTGKAVAGVIGKRKFSFDLWGDTINISSRLESHGEAGKIQISEKTWSLISRPDFFVEKGEIELKGKGKFKAYISLT